MSNIIETSWNEEKDNIKQVNPKLYQIILNNNQLIPSSLVKLQYSYGELVADGNSFKYPELSKSVKRTPFSLVIKNNFEMYIENKYWLSPWRTYKPGDFFPYTRFIKRQNAYQPSGLLELRAGSRSTFLLMNKEFDSRRYSALYKKIGVENNLSPSKLRDQFHVFKSISDKFGAEWRGEMLIFPEKWEEKAKEDENFIAYMEEVPIETHSYNTNIPLYNYIINLIIHDDKITSNSFSKDIIHHLFALINGAKPGYIPVNSESYAPINLIKSAFVDYYKPESSPIFMAAEKLQPLNSDYPLYYSLNIDDYLVKPTTLPNIGKLTKETMESFIEYCKRIGESQGAENTIFYKAANNISIHTCLKRLKEDTDLILSTNSFLKADNNFTVQLNEYSHLPAPESASFLSACLKLSF